MAVINYQALGSKFGYCFIPLQCSCVLACLVIKILDLLSMLRGAMALKGAKASVTIARMESAI